MIRRILTTLLLTFCLFPAVSQECALGVGGKDKELIVLVFQLSDAQQEKLDRWTEALEKENAELQSRAQDLLRTHPQETTEEVEVLGTKYREIKETMLANSLRYDRMLLGTFNELQYQRYVELCQEVMRAPMAPAADSGGGSGAPE